MIKKSAIALSIIATIAGINEVVNRFTTPDSTIKWEQVGATLEEVSALQYKYYIDTKPGVILQNVTCIGATIFTCSAPFSQLVLDKAGKHTLKVSAINTVGESMQSGSIEFNTLASK